MTQMVVVSFYKTVTNKNMKTFILSLIIVAALSTSTFVEAKAQIKPSEPVKPVLKHRVEYFRVKNVNPLPNNSASA